MGKHLGKHSSFGKPKPAKKGKPEAHFEIHHYAGTVGYNVTGWLFKNKDPVNEAVIGMMAAAGNPICALVFTEKDTGEKKKGSSMMTISAAHRESLMKLMTNLHSTHPHFVRCIIPNEIKKSGHIDAPLVMHQLNCNGVLEGIRICMLGLPNKVPHADFMTRYSIVAPKIFSDMAGNPRECAQKALVVAGMDADSFRCGSTKIMFRAGMLSQLEEIREGALSKIIIKMQCQARRVLVHVTYQGKIAEKKGISSIQRNIRLYYNCRDWVWYQFYTMLKGEIEVLKKKQAEEERRKLMAEGLAKFQAALDAAAAARAEAQANNEAAVAKIAAYKAEIEYLGAYAGEQAEMIKAAEEAANGALKSYEDRVAWVDNERKTLKATLASTKANLTKGRDDAKAELAAAKLKLADAAGGYDKLKNKAVVLTAETTAMKGNIAVIADAIAALDKKAAGALVEKREMWSTISACKFLQTNHSQFLRL
jgi:myosin heavy chain 6/7